MSYVITMTFFFLQETLLFKHELNLLSKVHPDFEGMGISAIDEIIM